MVSACVRVGSARLRLPTRIVLIWLGDHIARFPFGSVLARLRLCMISIGFLFGSLRLRFGSASVSFWRHIDSVRFQLESAVARFSFASAYFSGASVQIWLFAAALRLGIGFVRF